MRSKRINTQASHSNIAKLEALAALSGVMIALQSRANGELSHRLNNSLEAALVSFGSGLLVIAVIALFNPKIKAGITKLRAGVREKKLPKWNLFAGVLGGSFVALQTQVVPLIGVAIYSVASIAGQTAISLLVDRLGLSGGAKKLISKRRLSAAFITVAAVLISVWDRLSVTTFSILAVALSGLAGAFVGVQRAMNGRINIYSDQSFTTSLLNFIMGTSTLLIFLLIKYIFHHGGLTALPAGPWWLYTGGTIGVIYIAFSSTIVQHLGVLTFTLFSVGGTLLGSLLIDIFAPTNGTHVTWFLVGGILLTYLGVLTGGESRIFKR